MKDDDMKAAALVTSLETQVILQALFFSSLSFGPTGNTILELPNELVSQHDLCTRQSHHSRFSAKFIEKGNEERGKRRRSKRRMIEYGLCIYILIYFCAIWINDAGKRFD